MILEFKTKNYKSFVEEAVFSMTPAPKQKGLDYSLLLEKAKGKKIKGLCSSVVYGPNASGKTNIIGAMDTFRAIVLRGHIRNTEELPTPNQASGALELIPNNTLTKPEPVIFSIDFFETELQIHYEVRIDLGCFLDKEYTRKVLYEELCVNKERVFTRGETVSFGNLKCIRDFLATNVLKNESGIKEIAQNSLNNDELFLMNGFKLIISQSFVRMLTYWFASKFMVIYRADSMQIIKRFIDPQKQTVYVEETTNKAAKLFGINSNALGYLVSEDESDIKLCSIFKNKMNDKSTIIAAEIFESYGTIRFVNIFPLVIKALLTGGTLVVDEFDASIHPMALLSIINVFHNDEINVNHAQLIFNTHNPIFLNSNTFRRDEIKFVERETERENNSILYALSDFGTTGQNGVRKNEDYMKNYFISQYGAIKDIDFTPIFEELILKESEG